MPVLSHLHHLFNAAQCQAYIQYAALERPAAAMSALPEPSHWTVGHVPLSIWMHTLLVSWLYAHLQ